MVLFGLLELLSDFGGFIFHWGFSYGGIVTLIMGIIAIIVARNASTLVWVIVLIIVGLISGGISGLLVILAGILWLITALSKKA